MSMEEYYGIVLSTKPQVETFTGVKWNTVPDRLEYLSKISLKDLICGIFLAYEYFSHLRHHGFPSPLLDWTRSPYVAAYFAFRNAFVTLSDKVSIYAYSERPKAAKVSGLNRPRINVLGHYVSGHKRHFLQQCEYTICTITNNSNEHSYASHESAFAENIAGQDELWKFNLPGTEREKVLGKLEQSNINAFSLFSSDESLMEMLSIKEIPFRKN